jgi:hypothetical protein
MDSKVRLRNGCLFGMHLAKNHAQALHKSGIQMAPLTSKTLSIALPTTRKSTRENVHSKEITSAASMKLRLGSIVGMCFLDI